MKTVLTLLVALFLGLTLAQFAQGKPRSEPKEPKPFTLTCPAKFVTEGRFTYLVLAGPSEKKSRKFFWKNGEGGVPALPVKLKEGAEYTFTLHDGAGPIAPQITRIDREGKAVYDRSICEVHDVPMKLTEVPISYGIVGGAPDDPPWELAEKRFPNWRQIVYGGCDIGPDSPKTAHIYVCPECKSDLAVWRAKGK